MTISEMKSRIKALDDQILQLRRQRGEMNRALMEAISPFKIGEVITWRAGKRVAVGRVERINEWCVGEPLWIVRRIRKDGTDGEAQQVCPYMEPQLCPTKNTASSED